MTPTDPSDRRPAGAPLDLDPAALAAMSPLVIEREFRQSYRHSYGEQSPYFAALARGVLLGSRCPACGRRFASPRAACDRCHGKTAWFEMPRRGVIHSWTSCHFAAERFLAETPFTLILVEFPRVDTLLLSRLEGGTGHPAIGQAVAARFRGEARFDITDLCFVPVADDED